MCICVVVIHSLSCIQLFATPWTVAHQAPQSSTISRNLFKFMSTESVMPYPTISSSAPPSPFALSLSQHQVSQFHIRWPK